MATQKELDKTYMDMAIAMSKLSKGVRAKVGAVAVTKNGVVVVGVNGLPIIIFLLKTNVWGGKVL